MSPFITYSDDALTTELTRLQAERSSAVIRWKAGDTEAETQKSLLEDQIHEITEEISRRPSLAALIRRVPVTRTRAVFS